jgi:hypothetical protein
MQVLVLDLQLEDKAIKKLPLKIMLAQIELLTLVQTCINSNQIQIQTLNQPIMLINNKIWL